MWLFSAGIWLSSFVGGATPLQFKPSPALQDIILSFSAFDYRQQEPPQHLIHLAGMLGGLLAPTMGGIGLATSCTPALLVVGIISCPTIWLEFMASPMPLFN